MIETRPSKLVHLTGPLLLFFGFSISEGCVNAFRAPEDGTEAEGIWMEPLSGLDIDLGSRPTVKVETFAGSITATRGEPGKAAYSSKMHASGRTPDEEDSARENIDIGMEFSLSQNPGPDGTMIADAAVHVFARRRIPRPGETNGSDIAVRVPGESNLQLSTARGKILTYGVGRGVKAESGGGTIEVRDATGELNLSTVHGDVRIEANEALVSAATEHGSISFRGSLADGKHEYRATEGDIEIRLPAGSSFEIDARSQRGTITSRFPGLGPGRTDGGRTSLIGRAGSPGVRAVVISARTDHGNILVAPLAGPEP